MKKKHSSCVREHAKKKRGTSYSDLVFCTLKLVNTKTKLSLDSHGQVLRVFQEFEFTKISR